MKRRTLMDAGICGQPGHMAELSNGRKGSFGRFNSRKVASLVSRSPLIVFWPSARAMNRLRLTGTSPATAFSALATCPSIPRRVRRPRPARYWQ